jgi:CRP-like cAMP-binding protein/rhodanese-related sulfurtransferase
MENEELNPTLLRAFTPLDGFKKENLGALARKTSLKTLPAGRILFREGDNDRRTYYLVSGEIELRSSEAIVAILRGGSPEARNPIAPSTPRRFTARSASDVTYLAIDSDLLDVLLTWDQTGSYEVSELNTDEPVTGDDWMTTLLQTKAFHRIPPSNLQAIFMRMQRVAYRAGEVVIKQGDEGDFFYAIVSGRCVVTRETPLNREGIKLAELGPGDTFGEEALISEAKRNATVSMLSDGSLMRLNKQDFTTLLNEPMLHWVGYDDAVGLVEGSGAKWLDVRLPSEFDSSHLPNAINVPLYFLRLKLKQLDPQVQYIVVCDTGRRSSAGSFILNERGYNAMVLKGGLTAVDLSRRG